MNNGASWQRVNTGLTDTMIYSLGITGTDLYAGVASGGIWKRALSELVVGVDAATPLVPGDFTLEQNYPNPFNGVSQIGFRIPEAAAVKLKVFDLLGREVAVLVNEHKPAGSYQVRFEAGNLSSGVYVYKLTAGSMALTRKLVLMK
jgi:hypothetical protein